MNTRRPISPLASGWGDSHVPGAIGTIAVHDPSSANLPDSASLRPEHPGGRRIMIAPRHPLIALTALVLLLLLLSQPLLAQTQTVDFDDFTGPSLFSVAEDSFAYGVATFSGGQRLTATVNLVADQTTVYGTANFCSGCLPTITIDFSEPVSNVSLKVLNGLQTLVTYRVQDNLGSSLDFELVAAADGGQTTVTLPLNGVTQVQLSDVNGNPPQWDFLIDDVQFTAVLDSDGDGIPDATDNAPLVHNSDQTDTDGDGVGDVADNCTRVDNADQADTNGNLLGDACGGQTSSNQGTLPTGAVGSPSNPASPNEPILVNFTIAIDSSFYPSGLLVRPTCVRIFQEVTEGGDSVPLQERLQPTKFPEDLIPIISLPLTITCNVLDAVAPGSLDDGTFRVTGIYNNYANDPDIQISGGVETCTTPALGCFNNIFLGSLKSNTVEFVVADVPAATLVEIDIKFGTFPNSLNPDKKGTVPVTIFGSASFFVDQINVGSLRLAGSPVSKKNNGAFDYNIGDKNGDGYPDLTAHFVTPTRTQLNLALGQINTLVTVTGLFNGNKFTGVDSLQIAK